MAAAGGLVILMSRRDSDYQPFHRQYVHPASDSTFFLAAAVSLPW